MTADLEEIRSLLDRMGRLCRDRDPALIDFLWNDDGFRLFGSEVTDRATTRDELVDHFETIFAAPYRVGFAWNEVTVDRVGDVALVCALGDLQVIWPHRTDTLPYRLVAVLEQRDGDWRWRLFDGSQPAAAPQL